MPQQPIDLGSFHLVIEDQEAWFTMEPLQAKLGDTLGAGLDTMRRIVEERRGDLSGRRLLVDLQNTPVIDSLQIGALLALNKACRPLGRLGLVRVSDGVARLLRLTKIERLFDLLDEHVTL